MKRIIKAALLALALAALSGCATGGSEGDVDNSAARAAFLQGFSSFRPAYGTPIQQRPAQTQHCFVQQLGAGYSTVRCR